MTMQNVITGESKIHGTGVFTTRRFASGQVVLDIDDTRVVDKTHPLRSEFEEFEYHCDYLANGKTVLMKSPERHINSSCNPNVYVKTSDGIREVLALKEIGAGEEITYDYIINCHGGEIWECGCQSKKCRGTVPSSFFDLPLDQQLAYLPYTDDWFLKEHEKKFSSLNPDNR